MKKLLLALLPLALVACSTSVESGRQFADDPGQFGLYVASVNVFMDTNIAVKSEQTGQVVDMKIRHFGGDTGYVTASLPAGRYQLETYSPDGVNSVPLETPNGYFDVQVGCFNYGGQYEFGTDADGKPTYSNSSTLKDIEQLPKSIRGYAVDRDICAATMGKENERLSAADVKGQLSL